MDAQVLFGFRKKRCGLWKKVMGEVAAFLMHKGTKNFQNAKKNWTEWPALTVPPNFSILS
jgi:hypothetical protein